MLLVLQFPFADVRGFLADSGGRLSRPTWPIAQPGREFVRSSGAVRRRRRGGIGEWAGEEVYADASQVLRFPKHFNIACLFRRYYCEGTLARLEVGLRLPGSKSSAPMHALAILRAILQTDVTIRSRSGTRRATQLICAGDLLARHFLEATTAHRSACGAPSPSWWFSSGAPAVLLEHADNESLAFPRHTQHVLDVSSPLQSLRHAWLELQSQTCSVWFLGTGGGGTEATRRLRVHVMRLHAELECLRAVLLHFIGEPKFEATRNTIGAESLQSYLNRAVRLLHRTKRQGFNQCALLEAARRAVGVSLESGLMSLNTIRGQVAKKVGRYLREAERAATVISHIREGVMSTDIDIKIGNATVAGDLNVTTASTVRGSFNKEAGSAEEQGVRKSLQELTAAVVKLADRLPPQQAQRLTKDLEALRAEVLSTQPRQEWYELSAKGIVEAAKTVADMTAPVAAAISNVLSILKSTGV